MPLLGSSLPKYTGLLSQIPRYLREDWLKPYALIASSQTPEEGMLALNIIPRDPHVLGDI